MALFNYATRELSAKIVYYGPGLSGKTTNIEKVHELLKPGQKGKLISLPTETDRTLFFDFLPVQLGKIKGFNVRFHLYTVPGQVFYNATRRLVLQGVDGVVFVADSQVGMKESNLESLRNLEENLASYGKKLEELPFLIQLNKRDLKNVQTVEEMNASLNRMKVPTCEASALTGEGVIETLSSVSRLVFRNLRSTLLLPGESAADEVEEKIGETFGTSPAAAPEPPPPPPPAVEAEAVEELEEIADIEEIPEAKGSPVPAAEPFPSRFGEAIPFPAGEDEDVPDEVDLDAFAAAAPTPATAPGGGTGGDFRFAELDEIEVALPTPDSLAPPAVPEAPTSPAAPAPQPVAAPPVPDAPPAGPSHSRSALFDAAATAWAAPGEAAPPSRDDAAPPPVPSVRVEPEEGSSLTFLHFDTPSLDEGGGALLPMVFLDGDGNRVRVRLRLSMGER